MCGIFGYVGKRDTPSILLKGLERLEYRGYDSSGIAILQNNEIEYVKKTGRVEELKFQNRVRLISEPFQRLLLSLSTAFTCFS